VPIVRRLSDVDDLTFSTGLGGVDGMAYGTVAILFRPLVAYDSANRTLLAAYDLAVAQVGKIALNLTNKLVWHSGGSGGTGPTLTAGDWHTLVVRKQTGTANVRFSVKNESTGIWTHSSTAGTLPDWASFSGGSLHTHDLVSSWGPGCDYAAMAVWANELPWAADTFGDAEIESADLEDHLDNWVDAAPSSGWGFDVADANYSTEDFTFNRADETSTGVGTPVDAADLDFQYETTSTQQTTRNFLRNATTEPGTGDPVWDLSETQGTPGTLGSGNVSSGGFTEVLRWQRTVGDTVGAATISTQLSVASVSASAQYRWRLVRVNSSGVEQATSDYSGTHNTAGIKTSTFVFATTWQAGDRLALALEFGKTSGGGQRQLDVDVNSADSFADFELAVATPTDVTPDDTGHGHTADQPGLTQVHQVQPDSAGHAHTAGQATVGVVHNLAPDSTSHGHAAAEPTLVSVASVAPDDAAHAQAANSPTLTQAHTLTPEDAAHAAAAEQPAVAQVHALAPAGASHAHTATQPGLTGAGAAIDVREFTQGQFVQWAIGTGGLATLAQGAFTVVGVAKIITLADSGALLDLSNAGTSRANYGHNDSGNMRYQRGSFEEPGDGPSWGVADGWVLVAWTKAAGTAVVRFHKCVMSTDTWTQQDSAGTIGNDDNTCTFASTRPGGDGDLVLRGRIAAIAAFSSVLDDTAIQALRDNWADWLAAGPIAAWRFDQAATSESIDDQTGNGADQTTLVGSTVVTDDPPPGFSFGEAATEVTPAGASHGHAAAQPSLAQVHEIAPADAAHGHTADQPGLVQVHELAPNGAAHTQTATGPPVAQVHAVTADPATHGHATDSPALTQAHALAADDASHGHAAEAPSVVQQHEVAAAGATHAQTADEPALTQAHAVAAADTTHATAAGDPTLAQVHELAADGATHPHATTDPAVTQTHVLTAASASHGHTTDQPGLTGAGDVLSDPASHGHAATQPGLAQVHGLAPADAAHPHTADEAPLAQAHVLAADDASHGHTAGAPGITGAGDLLAEDASHAHTAGAAPLTQDQQLTPDDTSHGHSAQQPAFTGGQTLAADDAAHGHTCTQPDLAQAHQLSPADAAHGHTAGQPALTQAHDLAPADASHGSTAGQPALAGGSTLTPDGVSHGHRASQPAVAQLYAIAVAPAVHAHAAQQAALGQLHQLVPASTSHAHTAGVVAFAGSAARGTATVGSTTGLVSVRSTTGGVTVR
jgi:hypothetical protein